MSEHLSKVSQKLSILTHLNKGDAVLDIASNDGTLLNSYKKKGIVKVGIDPIINNKAEFIRAFDARGPRGLLSIDAGCNI